MNGSQISKDKKSEGKEEKKTESELQEETPPDEFFCPLYLTLMVNPVILPTTGQTYERAAIEDWFKTCGDKGHKPTCPITNLVLPHTTLTPNYALQHAIERYKKSLDKKVSPPAVPTEKETSTSTELFGNVQKTFSPERPESIPSEYFSAGTGVAAESGNDNSIYDPDPADTDSIGGFPSSSSSISSSNINPLSSTTPNPSSTSGSFFKATPKCAWTKDGSYPSKRDKVITITVNSLFHFSSCLDNAKQQNNLRFAAKTGDLATVQGKVGAGVNINGVGSRSLCSMWGKMGSKTALMLATEGNHQKVVDYLISQRGIDLNLSDLKGFTALDYAVLNGHSGIAKTLYENGAPLQVMRKANLDNLLSAMKIFPSQVP